ncbi:MAG: chemotaxis protein CheW [Planctomycetaceae bacterium]
MIDRHRGASPKVEAPMPECWRIVGVSGDRSCPELETFIHCRNCPVLAEAARTFFDRAAPAGYLDDWRAILEEPSAAADAGTTSVLVFRLEKEWFALPTHVLVEVTTVRPLHRIPHRAGGGLAGLVNIRGQLQLCMSLHALLGLPGGPAAAAPGAPATDAAAARMLVVERVADDGGRERWVLGADEVAGVHRLARTAVRAVPSTVSQAQARCSTALFDWQDRTVGFLDEARLFEGLRGMVTA